MNRNDAVTRMKAKIVLVGDALVGKTSLVQRYVWNDFVNEYLVTLGVVLAKQAVRVTLAERNVLVTMVLWDTIGDHALWETLRESYLTDAKGVMIVSDVARPSTLSSVMNWIEAARQFAGGAAVAVLANKSDLDLTGNLREQVLILGREERVPCYLTSAKSGANVQEAFEGLAHRVAARALLARERTMDPVSLGMVIDASARPRSLSDFVRSTGISAHASLAYADVLSMRGYLRMTGMALTEDGLPSPTFSAMGKSFPPTHPSVDTR